MMRDQENQKVLRICKIETCLGQLEGSSLELVSDNPRAAVARESSRFVVGETTHQIGRDDVRTVKKTRSRGAYLQQKIRRESLPTLSITLRTRIKRGTK